VFRFLKRDGTDGLEGRGQGHAHIPESGATAQQLSACNKALLGALYANKPCDSITLDMDATFLEKCGRGRGGLWAMPDIVKKPAIG
jgi:hypothetical protein